MKKTIFSLLLLTLPASTWASAEIYKTVDEAGRVTYQNVQPAGDSQSPAKVLSGISKSVDAAGRVSYRAEAAAASVADNSVETTPEAANFKIVRHQTPDGRVEFSNVTPVESETSRHGAQQKQSVGQPTEATTITDIDEREQANTNVAVQSESAAAEKDPSSVEPVFVPFAAARLPVETAQVPAGPYGSWPKVALVSGILGAGILLAWLFLRWIMRPVPHEQVEYESVQMDPGLYKEMQV